MRWRFSRPSERHVPFAAGQRVTFSVTAVVEGRVNRSPKVTETLHVSNPSTGAWLELTGSIKRPLCWGIAA